MVWKLRAKFKAPGQTEIRCGVAPDTNTLIILVCRTRRPDSLQWAHVHSKACRDSLSSLIWNRFIQSDFSVSLGMSSNSQVLSNLISCRFVGSSDLSLLFESASQLWWCSWPQHYRLDVCSVKLNVAEDSHVAWRSMHNVRESCMRSDMGWKWHDVARIRNDVAWTFFMHGQPQQHH